MKAIKRMKEIQKIQRLFQMPYPLGHGAFLERDECQSIEPY